MIDKLKHDFFNMLNSQYKNSNLGQICSDSLLLGLSVRLV